MVHHGQAASGGNIFPLDLWPMGFGAPWEWPSHASSHGGQAFHGNSRPVGELVEAGDQSPTLYATLTISLHLSRGKLLTLRPITLSDFAPDEWFACYEQLLKIDWRLQRTCISICHGKNVTMVSSLMENPFVMGSHGKLCPMGNFLPWDVGF